MNHIKTIFIKEETNPKTLEEVIVTDEEDHLIAQIEVSNLTEDEQRNYIRVRLNDLLNSGLSPTTVYIPVWSKMQSIFSSIWPNAKIHIDYNE